MAPSLTWRPLDPLGAEIDLDLSAPLTPEQESGLRQLFAARGLLLARGQSLTMARQRELCALLGPILERPGETGYMDNTPGGPSAAELSFHSDAAYTEHPFDALSLHALEVVDGASSTRFVSAEAAWEALAPELRERLAGREQEMIAPHYTELAGRTCNRRDPQAQKRGVMPTSYVNSHNGRTSLWVNEMQTARVLGMACEESRALLNDVFDAIYAPAHVLEHRWRNGDIVIWDNIALQHARGNVEGVGRRLLQRVIVGTEGVAPHVEAA
jgi:taurine dioxygenase